MDEIAICVKCQHVVRDDLGHVVDHPVMWKCRPKEDIDYQTGKPRLLDCQTYNPDGKCKFYSEMKPTHYLSDRLRQAAPAAPADS